MLSSKHKIFKPKTHSKIQILKIIQNVSMTVIIQSKTNYDDDILNISYDLFVVISISYDNNFNENNVRRIVFTVMTYLNYYTLERCCPLSLEYLVDDHIYGVIFNPNEVKSQLNELVRQFTDDRKRNDHDFLNLRSFYVNSVKRERVVVAYQNVFEFLWSGEKKNKV